MAFYMLEHFGFMIPLKKKKLFKAKRQRRQGKRYFFAILSREGFPEKDLNRDVLNKSPEIWDIFQELPEKIRKKGVCRTCFPRNSIVSREVDLGPLLYCISVV